MFFVRISSLIVFRNQLIFYCFSISLLELLREDEGLCQGACTSRWRTRYWNRLPSCTGNGSLLCPLPHGQVKDTTIDPARPVKRSSSLHSFFLIIMTRNVVLSLGRDVSAGLHLYLYLHFLYDWKWILECELDMNIPLHHQRNTFFSVSFNLSLSSSPFSLLIFVNPCDMTMTRKKEPND